MRPLVTNCSAARPSASGSMPAMVVETPVLIGNQHAQELRVDVSDSRSSAASDRRVLQSAQQLAVDIQHLGETAAGRSSGGGYALSSVIERRRPARRQACTPAGSDRNLG